MNAMGNSIRIALLLTAPLLVGGAQCQQSLPIHTKLTFSSKKDAVRSPIRFVGADGKKYVLELLPGWNTDGAPPTVGLTLRSEAREKTLQNLLAGAYKCCTAETTFDAKKFNDRTHLSATAISRDFHVKQPSLDLAVHVIDFKTATNDPNGERVPFSFEELTLEVSISTPKSY
jgi:hypothetical protein